MRRKALWSLPALPLAGVGFLATGFGPAFIVVAYLAAATPWLVIYDLREHRLPNALVLPGIGAGLLSCAGEWIVSARVPIVPLVSAAAYAGFLFVIHLVGGMGMGDVKLAAALGLASWTVSVAVVSPVIAFLVGGLVSTVLLIAGRRGQRIPFGPFLLGGFWAAALVVALARL
jgi:leader peptidase (prepilin peptidase) / N-methyltransferase